MYQIFDIVLVEFSVAVGVQFFELLPKEALILGDGGVEEAGDELSVVHLSAVVEVHRVEDLLDVRVVEVCVHLLPQVLKPDHHLLLRNHSVSVHVQLHEYFTQVLDLLLGYLDSQVH